MTGLDLEVYGGAERLANPVVLHGADLIGPVNRGQVGIQPIRVAGDAHHPLAQFRLKHGEVAAFGTPLGGDFFVRQHRAQSRRPVHRRVSHVGQALGVNEFCLFHRGKLGPSPPVRGGACAVLVLLHKGGNRPGRALSGAVAARSFGVIPGVENLQENPLGPLEIVRVGRGERAPPVVGQANARQLFAHVGDIVVRGDGRVLAGLQGVLFGGQAKRIVTHGVEHVLALSALVTGDHVGGDIAQRVSHVQTFARGVGEHIEDEVFFAFCQVAGQGAAGVISVKCAGFVPNPLPFCFQVPRHLSRVAVLRGVWGFRGVFSHYSSSFRQSTYLV